MTTTLQRTRNGPSLGKMYVLNGGQSLMLRTQIPFLSSFKIGLSQGHAHRLRREQVLGR